MKNSIMKDILTSIRDTSPKTQPYDTTAEVVRVDGDTLWVHIPGGVDETPVRKSINANIGDTVNVRVSGGSAWLTGNTTAPPTDDTTANVAKHTAETAQRTAKTAKSTAETASRIAGNIAQHFWMTEEGTDTGAHITEVTQEEFLADPENGGGNLLARSNGIAVRAGLTELASFSADGILLGLETEGHADIDFNSLRFANKDGSTFLNVSDLRDMDGKRPVSVSWSEGFTEYYLQHTDISIYGIVRTEPYDDQDWYVTIDGLSVKVGGSEVSNYTVRTKTINEAHGDEVHILVELASTALDTVEISYYITDACRTFSFGMAEATGDCSVAEGFGNATGDLSHSENMATASGLLSHAEGNSIASGIGSHSEGGYSYISGDFVEYSLGGTASGPDSHAQNTGTVAGYYSQTAIGKYNDNQSNDAFEIGNGSSKSARSNALTVDWNGNVDAAGDITDGNGNVLSNKVDKVTGKGLSTKDYTTAEKNKLAGIEAGAEVNPTISSATGTVNSNITVSRATCRLLKIGNVVFITVAMGNITSSVNTNTNLFTIPAAYRPSSNVTLQGRINDSVGNFTVRSDGYVRQTLVSALSNCFCAGFYTI